MCRDDSNPGVVLTLPILARMKPIEGWLDEDEADLLIATCSKVVLTCPDSCALVEVGSYCGRSTVVLGSVIQAMGSKAHVYAIDPHEGTVGAEGDSTRVTFPTLARCESNLAAAGLGDTVTIIAQRSFEVQWDRPISVLFIDGLHDFNNVARDFQHFEPYLVAGGYAVFHDYGNQYTGVTAFVDDLMASRFYRRIACVRSTMVLQKRSTPTG